eukprot:TRINITY_DN17642_c0_g2_i1.p1 TRINITY_DN17642_c0_g2~~TRINITY_DN17642_c0_g2_i1.p1  ORF type:complete len:981 (+),score=207.03 TRINITY_DN17642_c0_g2_i1:329-2944(+)
MGGSCSAPSAAQATTANGAVCREPAPPGPPDERVARFIRVYLASLRLHDLARSSSGNLEQARRVVGSELKVDEVEDALAWATADLELLKLDDDPDLSCANVEGGTGTMSVKQALALQWLAWREAFRSSVVRASSGTQPLMVTDVFGKERPGLPPAEHLRPSVANRLVDEALAALKESALGGDGGLSVAAVEVLASVATAASRHAAARRVAPRNEDEALEEYRRFESACSAAASHLSEELQESTKWLVWNAAWHAANIISKNQMQDDTDSEEEEDDDEEEDQKRYGEEYPGVDRDPLSNFAQLLRHVSECHRGDEEHNPPWRGLILPADAEDEWDENAEGEELYSRVRSVGFDTIRLPVVQPAAAPAKAGGTAQSSAEVLASVAARIGACASAGLRVVLDLSAWSVRKARSQEALLKAVQEAANAIVACRQKFSSGRGVPVVCAVALPKMSLGNAAPLVAFLRAAGLDSSSCALILSLEDAPVDDNGEYSGSLKKALLEGELSFLMRDGHIVFEVLRRSDKDLTPQEFLDAASHCGENIDDSLPLSCARFGLALPADVAKASQNLGLKWREELLARHEAACGESTHGWFANLDDGKKGLWNCLRRRWKYWPDPEADRILQVHNQTHVATLIFLHGFMCDGGCYLACPEEFYRSKAKAPRNGAESEGGGDEDEDEDGEEEEWFVPYQGLKVVLPTAPLREVTCHHGKKNRSWYDYLTDHDGKKEDDLDFETLEAATARIHRMLDAESKLVRGGGNVYLGGSSQGCCTALHAAMTYPGRLGGVVGCQGHLLSCTRVPADWAARGTPVRIFNGLADTTMPWEEWVSDTFDPLRSNGSDTRIETEEGVEHCDDEAEAKWVRKFLAEMWERRGTVTP